MELIIRGSNEEVADFLSRFQSVGTPIPCAGEAQTNSNIGTGEIAKDHFSASATMLDKTISQAGILDTMCGYVRPFIFFK